MRFPTPFPVLFNGTLELSTRLPRAYLPLLLGLTLPEPVLLLLGAGIGLAMVRMRRRGWWRDPAFLPIATTVTAAVFPVVYAVVRRTPMYNGTRHTLFILPALACLAAVSLDALLDRLAHGGHRRIRTLLVTLLAVAALRQVAFDARMFPYEYASFNTLAGGLPGAAGRFDLEYWGTSTTEASTRLAARVAEEPGTRTWRVLVCVNRNSVPEALGPRFLPAPDPVHADFLVGITAKWAECVPPRGARPLLTVSRMGVPLAFVLDLRHQEVPRGSRGRGNPVRPER
jgi:hypothetical protein